MRNIDQKVVQGFGDEWKRFDYRSTSDEETLKAFNAYFLIFPWDILHADAEGFDAGCGSGRWARIVARRVGKLNVVDASSDALSVARENLRANPNAIFHHASVAEIPVPDGSQDFGYSLGVLHHIPDTQAGLDACVRKLKPGAPFLLYIYYRFDNRSIWFRMIWRISDFFRRVISYLPYSLRYAISQCLALVCYFPLARFARAIEWLGGSVNKIPLSYYRDKSFYMMRNDALDRFGTRLEKRFTRAEIAKMMACAGLTDIKFSEIEPFWCAVGIRQSDS